MIAKVPRISFKRLQENKADVNDWYNLSFRIKVGHYLAEKLYAKEAVIGLSIAFDCCKLIGERWLLNKVISATPDELADIEISLDAVDSMHTENTRRYLLEAYHAARDALSGNIN